MPAVSNVVAITILPDDPEWDATRLRSAIEILDNRRVAGILEYDRRRMDKAFGPQRSELPWMPTSRLPGPAATRYYDALRALAVLDTEDAIRERVRRLKMPSVRDWRLTKGTGYSGIDDRLVILSTRPDLVASAIEARASEPEFGVQYGYVVPWMEAVAQRDNAELFSALHEEPVGSVSNEYREAFSNARAAVLESLTRVLEQKAGLAREMTATTVQMLRRDK